MAEQEQPQQSLLDKKVSRREGFRLGMLAVTGVLVSAGCEKFQGQASSTPKKPPNPDQTQIAIAEVFAKMNAEAIKDINEFYYFFDKFVKRVNNDIVFWVLLKKKIRGDAGMEFLGGIPQGFSSGRDEESNNRKDKLIRIAYWSEGMPTSDFPPSVEATMFEIGEIAGVFGKSLVIDLQLNLQKNGGIILKNSDPDNMSNYRRPEDLLKQDVNIYFNHPKAIESASWEVAQDTSSRSSNDNNSSFSWKYIERVMSYNGAISLSVIMPFEQLPVTKPFS